ncbi:hypothetical protein JCM11491_000564 [Sporobolomyces phaffii]
MHLALTVTALLLPTLGAAATAATSGSQVYFASSSSSSSSSSTPRPPVSLTAPQANAVFAHHLGVSSYVDLPLSSQREGGREWELALVDPPATDSTLVVVLECPASSSEGCRDVVPAETVQRAQQYLLPPLPAHSYLAAIALHLHRLCDSLELSPEDSPAVQGLKRVVHDGLKSVAGWQGWVGKELASWIGYDPVDQRYRTQPEHSRSAGRLVLSDLDFVDESGTQLASELEHLVSIADSFTAQATLPKIVVVHLKGLRDVAVKHSPSSEQYQRAAALVRETVAATLASYARVSDDLGASSSTMLVTLAAPRTPLLRKRQPWLHPFSTSVSRYTSRTTKRSHNPEQHRVGKRASVFVAPRAASRNKNATVIVPTSSRCFSSLEDLNDQTASCLSHGQGVKGISTRGDAKECWVCKCGSTVDQETGKKTYWAGEGCEKVDLSGSFSLLFFSSLGLVLILVASVTLLYKVGSVDLPGTLSAVGGTGGGHIKRD